ncbi:MAG TPA: hypothetical protein VIK18_03005 [Pirellulales bacterium]
MQKSRIMYVENKNTGDAFIGRVKFSKTGRTLYYRDKVFQSSGGRGICGNYIEVKGDFNEKLTEESYREQFSRRIEWWISGPKKNGCDSHYEKTNLTIDEDVAEKYWTSIRGCQPSE